MAEEYKNFNEYEKSAPNPDASAPRSEENTVKTETASPDPNPPTGWAPGHGENTAPSVSRSSPLGIVSIILSLAGYCTYGIASIVGIFLGAKAFRRNKSDVTAKVGLTACILMTLLWVATIAFYIFTPTGREMFMEIMESSFEMLEEYNELYSASDIYSLFRK